MGDGGFATKWPCSLIELAKANRMPGLGVLWLLDEMVHYQAITSGQAANALGRMLDQGARLPPDECRKRFAKWSRPNFY
jgi:hypothetical protein